MEECSIEVKGEVQQIFNVLSKEDEDKMPFEGIQIAKTLARVPFFRRFFDTNSEHFINLCIGQSVVEYQEGTEVYQRQQSEGRQRYLYVVLSGCVGIGFKDKSKNRTLGILRIFGQLEIVFELGRRQERAVCNTKCRLMRICQSSLLKILTHKDTLHKCLHFLNRNIYFEQLSELEKMQLTLGLTKKGFEKNQNLKLEHQGMQEVLFFIYGKAEVIARLSQEQSSEYIIDELEQMSSFGEYECVNGCTSNIKIRGAITGGYYAMNFKEMVIEQHKIIQILKQQACPYPSVQNLNFLKNVKSTLKKEEKRIAKLLF